MAAPVARSAGCQSASKVESCENALAWQKALAEPDGQSLAILLCVARSQSKTSRQDRFLMKLRIYRQSGEWTSCVPPISDGAISRECRRRPVLPSHVLIEALPTMKALSPVGDKK